MRTILGRVGGVKTRTGKIGLKVPSEDQRGHQSLPIHQFLDRIELKLRSKYLAQVVISLSA